MKLTCWAFPRLDPYNPYQGLLGAALGRAGVEEVSGPRLTPLWATRVSRADAVHLHWIEFLVFGDRGWPGLRSFYSALRVLNVLAALIVLRLRGLPIVWTVHNLAPHESRHPRLEHLFAGAVAGLATTLHVHSEWAGKRVVEELGVRRPEKVLVAAHGNYLDSYGPPRPRAESRRKLKLAADAHVYLSFGAIRPYKRIVEAIQAFAGLADPDAVLLVAGRIDDDRLRERIEAAADSRVRLRFGFVPDEEVGVLFGAADAALLNYAEVFSSGAMMAALSLGTPVVAPAGGTAAEVAGEAVEPFEPGELTEALERVVATNPEARGKAALAVARHCDWDIVANRLAKAMGVGTT